MPKIVIQTQHGDLCRGELVPGAKPMKSGMNIAPILQDVAAEVGVSTATVSVVINGKVGKSIRVSAETQARIWEVARKLGYIGNPAARSLAGGSNQIISIFTYEAIFASQQHRFYYPFLLGIEKEAEIRHYDLLLVTHRGEAREQRHARLNRLRMADGAILVGMEQDEEEVAALIRSGFPLVTIGKREYPGVANSWVAPDYLAAAAELVMRAHDLGHRHFAYIRLPEERFPTIEREQGFLAAVSSLTDVRYDIVKWPEYHVEPEVLDSFISQGVTCFVIERYPTCVRVARYLDGRKLSVPQDVSLVALGGPGRTESGDRDWTTIEVPGEHLGQAAFRILANMIEKTVTEPVREIYSCRIAPGATLGQAYARQ